MPRCLKLTCCESTSAPQALVTRISALPIYNLYSGKEFTNSNRITLPNVDSHSIMQLTPVGELGPGPIAHPVEVLDMTTLSVCGSCSVSSPPGQNFVLCRTVILLERVHVGFCN